MYFSENIESNRMIRFAAIFLYLSISGFASPYNCGENKTIKRGYGTVELRVICDYLSDGGFISVLEFRGDVQHGIKIDYDSLWRKRDSSFYRNGKKNGQLIFWDSLGNVVGRESFRNGIQVGKRESYFAPGRPALIKHYNSSGKAHGPWSVWWKNGNKKAEFVARNGEIVSGTEYYQDGQPRAKYLSKYEPRNLNVLKIKRIECEAWAPNGKSTGKITKGNGEWILFPDGSDKTVYGVFREVYKDSLMISVGQA
jgi:antitoxin component YwqK of YwqJK toxin-antitoxin module